MGLSAQILHFNCNLRESAYNKGIGGVSMNLGKRLLEVRENAKMSRAQLASLLKQKGFDVKPYTIGKWETGVSKPTVEAFLALCDICRVIDVRQTFGGKRFLRLYDLPVSAGLGNYLADGGYSVIEVDNTVPYTADYAARVSGDSMIPRFVDQQIIFVHEQPALDEGEIGIFCLNNQAYLKKLESGYLVSLNPAYEPIPVRDSDDIKVIGKVVG
jgi:transcriptional regulator with XRE-family HTH domain